MEKFKKYSQLWICRLGIVVFAGLGSLSSLHGGAPVYINDINDPNAYYNCNLPAPQSLQATNVTATTVTVQWAPVPGAVNYLVTALDANNQLPYYSNITGSLSDVCTGLPSNTAIEIRVAAICQNGITSVQYSGLTVQTNVVIDLVINGYQNCTPPNSGTTLFGNGNPLQASLIKNQVYDCRVYLISNPTLQTRFNILAESSLNPKNGELRTEPSNGQTGLGFFQSVPSTGAVNLVGTDNSVLSEFTLSPSVLGGNTSTLTLKYLPAGYAFQYAACTQGGGGSGDGKGFGRVVNNPDFPGVFPNPFSNQLSISVPRAPYGNPDPTRVQLLRLDGALVYDQEQTPDDNGLINIQLDNIPGAFYIIRVQNQHHFFSQVVSKVK